jgi:hypothetical protein
MTWVKLDDGFPDHPKIDAAGPEAAWLYVAGLCWCSRQLTDGTIAKTRVARLTSLRNPTKAAAALVQVGLWVDEGDVFAVNDYHDYNPTKDAVVERRARREKASRKAHHDRWHAETKSTTCSLCYPPSRNGSAAKSHAESHGEPHA